jgi:hypothetical protein
MLLLGKVQHDVLFSMSFRVRCGIMRCDRIVGCDKTILDDMMK